MGAKFIDYQVDQIKEMIVLWNDHTISDIAERIGVPQQRIPFLAKIVRECGYDLAKKVGKHKNSLKAILDEIATERGIVK
jgi:DNA-directed RNA polymerase sigma subunit (sigma70/sigma32)